MRVKNAEALATTEPRKHLLSIIDAGLSAIEAGAAIGRHVQLAGDTLTVAGASYDLTKAHHIYVVGVGKCSVFAAKALDDLLGSKITGGIIADVRDGEVGHFDVYIADHPLTTDNNVAVTAKILNLLESAGSNDLVICLISGGGSAMLCQPKGISASDEANIIKHLFKTGADIYELNTVRKHLSVARGGGLARAAYPAQVISLIFSDVLGNNLEFISSGPTVKDTTTVADAEKILQKYNVREACNVPGLQLIETEKSDKFFSKVRNVLAVSNDDALAAMAKAAESCGYKTEIRTNALSGEVGQRAQDILKDIGAAPAGTALLYGGELTINLGPNPGKGGRCLEFSLATLEDAPDNVTLVSFATDGHDNTDFAGAIVDSVTRQHAKALNLATKDYLPHHDSYTFFQQTNDYIITGVTGSNVSDIIIALKTDPAGSS